MQVRLPVVLSIGLLSLSLAQAQEHDHSMHAQHMMQQQNAAPAARAKASEKPKATTRDMRQVVYFPAKLREETLTNMRDHLLAMQQIQHALSKFEFDQAADIAEQRLGMSSLGLHGAHEVAKYMPEGMKAVGSAMHRNASRLAVVAKDAGATGDLKPVFEAMSNVTAQCVTCHAGFRVK